MKSKNIANENYQKLAALFPNAVTETITGYDDDGNAVIERAIDKDVLMQEIATSVVEGREERYQFTWPDKKKAILTANAPINKTLRPCKEESVDFDNTENLYIEGDNLEVLKLLQETYLGKIKMIYIDPPYNTGNDFVYNDDFKSDIEEYVANSGQQDEAGNRLVQNTENNGRFHTDWLNMFFPRIKIARQLLRDDGVIFVSIDNYEIDNCKKVLDEVFGSANMLHMCVWDLGTGTAAGHFTRSHEYVLVYAKNKDILDNFYAISDENIVHGALKKISKANPASEITFPEGFPFEGQDAVFTGKLGGSEEEFIISDKMEFKNGKLVKPTIIKAGWGMKRQVIDWIQGKETYDSKGQKVIRFYFNSQGILFYEKERGTYNPKSVIKEMGSTKNGTKELESIFGFSPFPFPKPSSLIGYFIRFATKSDDIILDFFSGSGTTGQSVMQVNKENSGNRKFILIQVPESTTKDSEAYLNGYMNICEIGKDRLRKIGKDINEQIDFSGKLDVGFRVFKLDSSNMEDVFYRPSEFNQESLFAISENIKPDRTAEDLLFQVMLDLGVLLSSKIEEEVISGKSVYSIADGFLIACFDADITDQTVTEIAKRKPYYAVFRDSGMATDSVATNFDQIFETYSPNTVRRIL